MLRALLSAWYRYSSNTERPTEGGAPVDRRSAPRRACSVAVECKPVPPSKGAAFSGKVLDLSQGGISLHVEQELSPGMLLSVTLPGEKKVQLLVCVLHARAHSESGWVAGCCFACELSAEDLATLGGKRELAPETDRRVWVRFSCPILANWELAHADSCPQSAEVYDVSANGIGLLVSQEINLGELLHLELLRKDGSFSKRILCSVVRTAWVDPETWLWGCTFISQLNEAELRSLLQNA